MSLPKAQHMLAEFFLPWLMPPELSACISMCGPLSESQVRRLKLISAQLSRLRSRSSEFCLETPIETDSRPANQLIQHGKHIYRLEIERKAKDAPDLWDLGLSDTARGGFLTSFCLSQLAHSTRPQSKHRKPLLYILIHPQKFGRPPPSSRMYVEMEFSLHIPFALVIHQ